MFAVRRGCLCRYVWFYAGTGVAHVRLVWHRNAARENARRQALAAVNDLVRAYGMLDVKLNRTLLDNIMILGLRHAIEPLDAESQPVQWELP